MRSYEYNQQLKHHPYISTRAGHANASLNNKNSKLKFIHTHTDTTTNKTNKQTATNKTSKRNECRRRRRRRTYVHGAAVFHARGDQGAPAALDVGLVFRLPALRQLAVHVEGDDGALHGHAQLVPLAVEEGVEVAAPEGVVERVLLEALEGELHRPLCPVHHQGHLWPEITEEYSGFLLFAGRSHMLLQALRK